MANQDVYVKIIAQDGASATFQKIGHSAQVSGQQMSTAATKASRDWEGAGRKIGLAIGAVSALAVKANAESERADARLRTSIEATGKSYDQYAEAIKKAQKAAIAKAFDDEDAADAISTLTQATGDASRAINDLALAEDVARARNIDLAAAANIVAAAEQGRYGILARMGIQISDNATKEQALAEIQRKVAGQSDAYAQTSGARWQRYQIDAENALESVGSKLAGHEAELLAAAAAWTTFGAAAKSAVALLGGTSAAGGAAGAGALGPAALIGAAIAAAIAAGYIGWTSGHDPGSNTSGVLGEFFQDAAGAARKVTPGSYGDALFQSIQAQFGAMGGDQPPATRMAGRGIVESSALNVYTPPWFPSRSANPQADLIQWQSQQRAKDAAFSATLHGTEQTLGVGSGGTYAQQVGAATNRVGQSYGSGARIAGNVQNAVSGLDTSYRTIVGGTQAIAQQSDAVDQWARDLINVKGEYGKIDDLLARGVITSHQYFKAQQAGTAIFAANAKVQDQVLAIQTRQAPAIAEAEEQLAKYLESLKDAPKAQQLAALGFMDTTEAMKAQSLVSLAAEASLSGYTDQTEQMIVQAAEADPILASMLESLGLISTTDGEIKVNFPEGETIQDALDTLNETLAHLDATIATIGVDADTSAADAKIAQIETAQYFALVSVGADTSAFWNSIPSGVVGQVVVQVVHQAINPFADGGTVPYGAHGLSSMGGTFAIVGEHGPEMTWLPSGAQVTNTVATQSRMSRMGSGGGDTHYHINGGVHVSANTPDEFASSLGHVRR